MAGYLNLWPRTEESLLRLESLLVCSICQKVLRDPHTLTSCEHTFCRLCIVDALSSQISRCPECSVPAWLKDVKGNRQLNNIVRLLITMKEQILPSTSFDEDKSISLTNTMSNNTLEEENNNSQMDGHHCRLECSVDIQSKSVSVKSQTEAQMIKQHLQSSSLTPEASVIPQTLMTEINNDMTEVKTNDGVQLNIHLCSEHDQRSHSLSSMSLPMSATEIKNRKRDLSISEATTIIVNNGEEQYNPSVKQSLAKAQNCVPVKSNASHTDVCVTPIEHMYVELPFSPLISKTRNFAKLDTTHKIQRLHESGYQTLLSIKHLRKTSIKQKNLQRSITSPTSKGACSSSNVSFSAMKPNSTTVSKRIRRNIRGETPLHIAAIKGDVSAVRALVQQGAEVNAKDNAGWTPLHEACNHGHFTVVSILLNSGALVNVPGLDNDTPLHDAVANDHVDIASLLICQGANTCLRNCHGKTPHNLAVSNSMMRLFNDESFSSPSVLMSKDAVKSMHVSPQLIEGPSTLVLLGTGLKIYQKNQLDKLSVLLGAQVVDTFSPSVSHVVTVCDKSGCCPRTLKFLCAVASGKWILNFEWVYKCLQNGCWVNEESYEVRGVNTGNSTILSEAPRKGRQNRAQQAPGLFHGCEFYFSGSFPPPGASKEDLIHIVQLSDGKVLTREPLSSDQDDSIHPFHSKQNVPLNKFIVYDPCTQVPFKSTDRNVAVLPVSQLLDSLSHFDLSDLYTKL